MYITYILQHFIVHLYYYYHISHIHLFLSKFSSSLVFSNFYYLVFKSINKEQEPRIKKTKFLRMNWIFFSLWGNGKAATLCRNMLKLYFTKFSQFFLLVVQQNPNTNSSFFLVKRRSYPSIYRVYIKQERRYFSSFKL